MSQVGIDAGVKPVIDNIYVPEYSNDGKLAKVYFDAFSIAYNAFDESKNLKEEA